MRKESGGDERSILLVGLFVQPKGDIGHAPSPPQSSIPGGQLS